MPVGFRIPREYNDFDYKEFSVEALQICSLRHRR